MSTRKILVASLLLCIAAFDATVENAASAADVCQLAGMPARDFEMKVPFDLVDGRIYVQAGVDGRGSFRFAVDTGASGWGRADASLAAALHLKARGQATNSDGIKAAQVATVHLDSLALGRLVRKDLDVMTRDYNSHMSPAAALSGIVGRQFFADGLLVIDYPARTLSFSRKLSLPAAGENVLGYERAFRVPVSIGNVQAEGNLDTGANVAFVLPKSLFERVSNATLEPAGHGRLSNSRLATQRAMVRGPFRIGDASLSNVEVRVSDRYPELLVGAHALQHFIVMIDQRSRRIAVCH